jgi:Notch-like protein
MAFTDLCSYPKAEEMTPPSKCQLWPLNGGCGELPQVAMLTPPQESEIEAPDVDTCGPGM